MKLAIISDIHANLEALRTVLDDAGSRHVERIICLGDLVGYNADPAECLNLLRRAGAICIAGNHDRAVAGTGTTERFSAAARQAAAWTQRQLGPEDLAYLADLPLQITLPDVLVGVHGTLLASGGCDQTYVDRDARRLECLAQLAAHPAGVRICAFGHTHLLEISEFRENRLAPLTDDHVRLREDAFYLLNPGSVGQPRTKDRRATYFTYETESRMLDVRRLSYDGVASRGKTRAAGLAADVGILPSPAMAKLKAGMHAIGFPGVRSTVRRLLRPAPESREPRVELLDPRGLTTGHLAAWRSFQGARPALDSPFLTPEFIRIVAETRRNVVVAVFAEGDRIAGFFPFQRHGRTGKPVAGPLSDCQAVIAAPWWNWNPVQLVEAAGLSLYDFTNQRAEQHAFGPFVTASFISPLIDLSRGFDAYVLECRERAREMPGTSSGFPHQTMARMRRLERQLGPLRFEMHDPDPRALRAVLRWKSQQYRQSRHPDAFSVRWTVELLERIQAAQAPAFAGVLSTLYAGDRLLAAHMGMRSATVLHWWFPAYDVDYAKFSPGMVLLLELSRSAVETGIRTIELGAGEEPYKRLVANSGIEVAAGYVGPASLAFGYRRLQDASLQRIAELPVGALAQWPAKFVRRVEMLRRYK